jgi:hypothetical protein
MDGQTDRHWCNDRHVIIVDVMCEQLYVNWVQIDIRWMTGWSTVAAASLITDRCVPTERHLDNISIHSTFSDCVRAAHIGLTDSITDRVAIAD